MKTEHSGKLEGAKALGVSAGDAVAPAASGALKGAGEVGPTASTTIRKAFIKIIHGVKVVAREPEAALFSNN